ncbi:Pyridoxine 5'-phosphate synthase [Bienertia sinuspersici]
MMMNKGIKHVGIYSEDYKSEDGVEHSSNDASSLGFEAIIEDKYEVYEHAILDINGKGSCLKDVEEEEEAKEVNLASYVDPSVNNEAECTEQGMIF